MPGEQILQSKVWKVFVPQVLFMALWICYLLVGAVVFMKIEGPAEELLKAEGMRKFDGHLQPLLETAVKMANFDSDEQVKVAEVQLRNRLKEMLMKFDLQYKPFLSDYYGDRSGNNMTMSSAMLFAFPLLTTIGFGVVTPTTVAGRVFCIVYGAVGIPAMMITIANLGKFVSILLVALVEVSKRLGRTIWSRVHKRPSPPVSIMVTDENDVATVAPEQPTSVPTLSLTTLGVVSLLVLLIGSLVVNGIEQNDFFASLYFCFISLTTVGFGDIFPTNEALLPVTFLLFTVGLAVMTLTIQFVAGGLRKIHYLGRKISGSPRARTWFGGRLLSVGEIIATVGEHLHIPAEKIAAITENLDDMLETLLTETDKDRVKERRKSLRPREPSVVSSSR